MPGLRGVAGHSATSQHFPLTSDVRVWGSETRGILPSRSITALGQQSCKRHDSPALTRKQFLGLCARQAHQVSRSQYYQHCLVSCPTASSVTMVFWGVVVFLRCIEALCQAAAKARGRYVGAVPMEVKA